MNRIGLYGKVLKNLFNTPFSPFTLTRVQLIIIISDLCKSISCRLLCLLLTSTHFPLSIYLCSSVVKKEALKPASSSDDDVEIKVIIITYLLLLLLHHPYHPLVCNIEMISFYFTEPAAAARQWILIKSPLLLLLRSITSICSLLLYLKLPHMLYNYKSSRRVILLTWKKLRCHRICIRIKSYPLQSLSH